MRRSLGLNVDWQHSAAPADVAATGASWVRSILRPHEFIGEQLTACRLRDMRNLLLVVRESWEWADPVHGWPTSAEIREAARVYVEKYGHLMDAVQFGNEPDLVSPSSWTMPPDVLNGMLAEVRPLLPGGTLLIGPGLASGQPYDYDYSLVDVVATHPYVPADQLYLGPHPSGKPRWVTEFPTDQPLGWIDHLLDEPGWEVAVAFRFSAQGDPGNPHGLLDADGVARPVYDEFRRAAYRLKGLAAMGTLESTESQADWPLGPRWKNLPITTRTELDGNGRAVVIRTGWYERGIAVEHDGDVWSLEHRHPL